MAENWCAAKRKIRLNQRCVENVPRNDIGMRVFRLLVEAGQLGAGCGKVYDGLVYDASGDGLQ
jgi:hypothetical protein